MRLQGSDSSFNIRKVWGFRVFLLLFRFYLLPMEEGSGVRGGVHHAERKNVQSEKKKTDPACQLLGHATNFSSFVHHASPQIALPL